MTKTPLLLLLLCTMMAIASVAVVVWLEWAALGNAQVVCLVVGEGGELGPELVEM